VQGKGLGEGLPFQKLLFAPARCRPKSNLYVRSPYLVSMLKMSGLTISFPNHPPVVNDLSFELKAGNRLGLLGRGTNQKRARPSICFALLKSSGGPSEAGK